AAAPEGTAVNNAAEFAAMTADGTYYLAADITIDATYMTYFTGTLDGNGHTVTVSVPMFHTVGGCVKNLKIEGDVTTAYGSTQTSDTTPTIYPWADVGIGAVAAFAVAPDGKTVEFDNIVSNAKVTCDHNNTEYVNNAGETKTAAAAAGAIYGVGEGNITISNCTNNGEITGKDQVGGFAGWADRGTASTITVINCVNNGTVNMAGNYGGGIVGRGSEGTNVFTNCTNNGALNCYKSQFGGVVGYVKHAGDLTITGCVNTGVPSDYDTTDTNYPNFGGIVGVTDASAAGLTITIDGCVNTASFNPVTVSGIVGGGIAAKLICKQSNGKLIVKNCLNTGEFTNCATVGGIVGQALSAKEILSTLEITRCTNFGDIMGASTATSGTCRIAGIIGHTEWISVTADHCVNNGVISDSETTTGVYSNMGGILGYFGGDKAVYDGTVNTFTACVNNGKINGVNSPKNARAGGIVGHTLSGITFNNCVNTGAIFSKNDRAGGICASGGDSNKVRVITYNYCFNFGAIEGKQVGGISGYQYGSEDETNTAYALVNGCANFAPVKSPVGGYAAGMIAYYNASRNTYINCFNGGAITSEGDETGHKANILGWNNKQAHIAANITGNIYVDGTCALLFSENAGYTAETDPTPVFVAANADAVAYAKAGTAAEAVAAINAAAGKTVLAIENDVVVAVCDHGYLGKTVEAEAPTCAQAGHEEGMECAVCGHITGCAVIPATDNHEYENGTCKNCGAVEGAQTPDTTEPGQSGDTGDSAWIYLAFAAVAVLGTAIIAKKREN
ncbi:MAG: hypothetical protein ACI3XI_08765, partial [Eubacteriales bacterium]